MLAHKPIVENLDWPNELACQGFAQQLAQALQIVSAPSVVLILDGDLGSGKTTFARYLLQALGVTGRIKSPSYTLVEHYGLARAARTWPALHFDFYRFNDPQEWEDAGFRDLFAANGLKIVEWASKTQGYLPLADLTMTLQLCSASSRRVELQTHTATGQEIAQARRECCQ